MERMLTIERLYNLGDFKSIKIRDVVDGSRRISNEVAGIPEELWLNSEFIEKLRYLQMIQMEATYFKYIQYFINRFHTGRKLDEVPEIINELDELEIKVITQLKDLLGEKND